MAKQDSNSTAAFSMAIETLRRINTIYWELNMHQFREDFPSWYRSILALWKELQGAVKLSDPETKEINDALTNKELKELLSYQKIAGDNRTKLYFKLYDIDTKLRILGRKYKINMISKADAGTAITQMG